jgi:hypothetical protein
MGLDNFWKKNQGETANIEEAAGVCGGMFTDHGQTSFRGKLYADLVEQATGVSLYQEEIPSEVILKMADSLDAFDIREYDWEPGFDIDDKEFQSFKKMFRLHADAGHYLIGWW